MLSADLAGGKYVERFASLESNCALAIINDVVHARRMSFGKLELVRPRSRRSSPTLQPGVKARRRQQVAAVCFRILSTGVEFLLVRTRRGRWTFPKGGAQAGFTHAQSAALEAFEEAGVKGKVRYFWGGEAYENELVPIVEGLLAGQPIDGEARFGLAPGQTTDQR